MRQKRQINGRHIINDLRSGLTDRELLMNYCLSANGLCRIFEKLVDRGDLSHSELSHRSALYRLRTSYKESRTYPRADLAITVPIYDLATSSVGILRDISERGLRVAGIDTIAGRAATLQVPLDRFLRAEPLLMVVECKWAKTRHKRKKYVVAGFEIIDLSAKDSNTLQDFMSVLLLSESGRWKTLKSTGNPHDQRRCGWEPVA